MPEREDAGEEQHGRPDLADPVDRVVERDDPEQRHQRRAGNGDQRLAQPERTGDRDGQGQGEDGDRDRLGGGAVHRRRLPTAWRYDRRAADEPTGRPRHE